MTAACAICGNVMPAATPSRPPSTSRRRLSGPRRSRNFARPRAAAAAILRAMIDRRHLLLGAALGALATRLAQATTMSRVTAYAFTFKALDGTDILLASYAGHPILLVNTASLCGYTPQYTGLQALWTRYRQRRGLPQYARTVIVRCAAVY